jgi:hypothetical protein
MPRAQNISLSVPEPLSLISATLDFTAQVLIAKHPDLLRAPEEARERSPPPDERAARDILHAVCELRYAMEIYRAYFPNSDHHDDIPF